MTSQTEIETASLSLEAKEAFDVDLNSLSGPEETGLRDRLEATRAALGLDMDTEVAYDSSWKAVVIGLEALEEQAAAQTPGAADIDALKDYAAKLQEVAKNLEVCRAALSGESVSASTVEDLNVTTNPENEKRIDLSLSISSSQSQEEYIREKLGTDGESLISDWKRRNVDLTKEVPQENGVSLLTDSNNKNREDQERHLKAAGLTGLADDIQVTNLCIEVVLKAQEAGIELKSINNEDWDAKGLRVEEAAKENDFSDAEATVLKMLTDGVLRTRSGGLYVYEEGRLRACVYCGLLSDANSWALGGVGSSAE